MTEEAERWKEKYLKSLEQQEKQERRWAARLDLLRRGLVRSTLAAEGSDRAVDECMKEMRDVIRSDNMDAALSGLIPRLEKAVLDSEQRREVRTGQVSTALTALVAQLQTLPLPGEVRRPLKKFAKQLESRVTQSREMPLLLSELSGLQGRALSALEPPEHAARPGLLQRLFGGREGEAQAAPETAAAPVETAPPPVTSEGEPETPPPVPDQEPADDADGPGPFAQPQAQAEDVARSPLELPEPSPELPAEPPEPTVTVLPQGPEPHARAEVVDEDGPYALPDAREPSYSSVATHIEQTLVGLLDELSLPEHHKAQALAMRERVVHGLNWYELIPVLDDLAVLMLAISDSGQHEFQAYLQQLNERLESFQSNLQEASAGHADNTDAARDLDSELREQVDGLQSSVHGAADLAGLRQVLDNRLEGLLLTMDDHRQKRDQREQDLAERLHGLSERVADMEQEAMGYREHLEEQRQKALVDPLTGLPNRAGWAEQVEQQVQAWQANGGHLSMAILDLDHFKRINDGYGHLAGDKVLKIVANVLRKHLRGRDVIARFGGEEFVLLLPQTPLATGSQLVETLRAAIEACPFHFKGERVVTTLSIGISAFRSGERADSVLKRADEALYLAKDRGRNRVEHK
ncbi:MAG TPA: GGDEF domain-containing protein [Pseudomonas sp.]|uniref:GGDEF domain-containing protein n=1 Tax=Pseudomonas sp. TaxID=306 RepID=UPI002B474D37|nr:GGDEF domain-containing protein [Pseudomonas sp.]HKS15401.1 GGDEF domain-containing protein [Pseudomonas sp.]